VNSAPIKRTGRTHELKTWPEPYAAILDDRKRFEIRLNDRGFAVGDVLVLKEYEPGDLGRYGRLTDRELRCLVSYLVPGGAWGLPANLCVMSVVVLDASKVTP
jgi:hypothetical protein